MIRHPKSAQIDASPLTPGAKQASYLTRRNFLRFSGLTLITPIVLAGCGGAAAQPQLSTPKPAPANTAAPTAAATTSATLASNVSPVATQAAAKPVTMKLGVAGTLGYSPFNAEASLKIFNDAKITLEIIEHKGGAEAAQALVGGGIDVFNGDFSHALRLNEQGQRILVIGGVTERHAYTLIGVPGAATGVETLKGKKIGITSPGSQTDTSMRWLLKNAKLDPEKDVELIAIGGGAPMLAALQNKQVYAGMMAEPLTSQLRTDNYPVVYDFYEETKPYQGTVYMAKEPWLKANEDTVRRFLAAYYAAVRKFGEDPAVTVQGMKKTYANVPDKALELATKRQIEQYTKDGKVQEAAVAKVFEFDRVARGLTDQKTPALSTFSDLSYLPKA